MFDILDAQRQGPREDLSESIVRLTLREQNTGGSSESRENVAYKIVTDKKTRSSLTHRPTDPPWTREASIDSHHYDQTAHGLQRGARYTSISVVRATS